MRTQLQRAALVAVLLLAALRSVAQKAIEFNGSSQYVTFGVADSLGADRFTLECWFYKKGAGRATTSGSGGITTIIPLISKGRGEEDGTNKDMNYILGINSTTGVLCADFEEGEFAPSKGLNHPVSATTVINDNEWYHAAVTFDGAKWRIYLNGILEKTDSIGVLPRSNSIQHAGLATALTSKGAADGYFQGIMDEVRIWNYARSEKEIRDSINSEVKTATGLLGRWSMDDIPGTVLKGDGKHKLDGTFAGLPLGTSFGAPFDLTFPLPNLAPDTPKVFLPKDSTVNYPDSILSVKVNDPEKDKMKVIFLGRKHDPLADSASFMIVPIPDAQFYTAHMNGATNEIFKAQTKWIADNSTAKSIVYAIQLGDCVQNGDNGGNDIEWKRADTSLQIIEDPLKTLLKDGIPYGICVGNHDQSPEGSATGATTFYNTYFGESRFSGRAYYGGHYGANNDNHYQLFSARGMDFISISLEYDTKADAAVLTWADSLLKAFPMRRGIVSSHWIINSDASWGAQGAAIYNRLKVNPNLDLMLCGHINPGGEARRTDVYKGNTVHTLLSDYQDRTKGGNGWLRTMEFIPAENQIAVRTYSPTLAQYETDANSEFRLDYPMTTPFDTIGTVYGAASGSMPSVIWNGLEDSARYDWFVMIGDGKNWVRSRVNTFTFLRLRSGTGITPLASEADEDALTIFPNPNNGQSVTISYPREVEADITINGLDGRQYYHGLKLLGSNVLLPVNLKPGVYLISTLVEGKLLHRRLIVQ